MKIKLEKRVIITLIFNVFIKILSDKKKKFSFFSTAKFAFEGVGNSIKRRRIQEFKCTVGCYLTDDVNDKDPAL